MIGAGAAGVVAARTLHDAGSDMLLVEAGDRVVGRARSADLGGFLVDLGCGWLHSAKRNFWSAIAQRAGVAIDRSSPHWGE